MFTWREESFIWAHAGPDRSGLVHLLASSTCRYVCSFPLHTPFGTSDLCQVKQGVLVVNLCNEIVIRIQSSSFGVFFYVRVSCCRFAFCNVRLSVNLCKIRLVKPLISYLCSADVNSKEAKKSEHFLVVFLLFRCPINWRDTMHDSQPHQP